DRDAADVRELSPRWQGTGEPAAEAPARGEGAPRLRPLPRVARDAREARPRDVSRVPPGAARSRAGVPAVRDLPPVCRIEVGGAAARFDDFSVFVQRSAARAVIARDVRVALLVGTLALCASHARAQTSPSEPAGSNALPSLSSDTCDVREVEELRAYLAMQARRASTWNFAWKWTFTAAA